ncbi:MAG TPA: glycosyltransferase family 39 protein [Clostridiales bacterium]|nr:glycosyltransferase family 39 protein [Clostridiales bacterium]
MRNNIILSIIILLGIFSLFINVGSYGAIETSDARYAEISREMYLSGDYIHPNLLNIHHYHKPPLTYQITSLGYSLFGINTFGARFFLQLTLIMQTVLIYFLSLALFSDRKSALFASIIYFSFPIVLASTRILTTDAFLTTFIILSIYSWVKYRQQGLYRFLYLFTLSLALGMLTKGPVVFIVPLSFILFYNKIEEPKNKAGFHHLLAWMLFAIVGFSWYIYLVIQNPNLFDYFIVRQTAERFTKNVFNRHEPFWYFIVYAPLLGLPWSFMLPYLYKRNKSLILFKSTYLALIAGIIIPLLFFSISSSKLILYILPIYSLFAILLAQLFYNLYNPKNLLINKLFLYYALLIGLVYISVLFFPQKMHVPKIISLFGIVFIGLSIWVYKSKIIDNDIKSFSLSFITSIILIISSSCYLSSQDNSGLKSSKIITDFIIANNLKNREILVYNSLMPSIAFALNKSIISLKDGSRKLDREVEFEKDNTWKEYFIDMEQEEGIECLKKIIIKPSVLIVYKHKLKANRDWILYYYKNREIINKWTIYW